jgi:F0F1-type ATP synthase epsilon subunit
MMIEYLIIIPVQILINFLTIRIFKIKDSNRYKKYSYWIAGGVVLIYSISTIINILIVIIHVMSAGAPDAMAISEGFTEILLHFIEIFIIVIITQHLINKYLITRVIKKN